MPHPEHSPAPLDYKTFLAAYDRAWRHFQADPTRDNAAVLQTGEQILLREFAKPGHTSP